MRRDISLLGDRSPASFYLVLGWGLLWFLHARTSLWADEFASWWTISTSFGEAWHRSQDHQAFSPLYYCGLWAWAKLFGTSEFSLRFPSLIAAILTLGVFYRIAVTACTRSVAQSATMMLALLFAFMQISAWVRPYAWAVLFATCSIDAAWSLTRSGSRLHRSYYIFSTALAIALHPLFGGVLLIQLWIFVQERKPRHIFLGLLSCVVVMSLLSGQWMQLAAKRQMLSISGMPGIWELFLHMLAPVEVLCFAFALSAAMFTPDLSDKELPVAAASAYWIMGWHCLPWILLYSISHLSGTPVFLERFAYWGLPALALLFAAAVEKLLSRARKRVFFKYLIGVKLVCFSALLLSINEPWRDAVAQIRNSPHVLLYSGLAEARRESSFENALNISFLEAPLRYYGYRGKITSLPMYPPECGTPPGRESWEGRYLKQHVEPALTELKERQSEFILFGFDNVLIRRAGQERRTSALKNWVDCVLDQGAAKGEEKHLGHLSVYELR